MRKIRIPLDFAEYCGEIPLKSDNENGRLFERAWKYALRDVIKNELSERQSEYIMLYYYEGLRMAEIAERCEVNVSTVSRTLSRARKNIMKSMKYYLSFR